MSQAIFEKYAALREKFPDDLKRIEAEEKRVSALLKRREFADHPTSKELIAMCRKDIVWARKKIAYNIRELTQEQLDGLLTLIDGRTWYLQQVAINFEGELSLIEADLQAELER